MTAGNSEATTETTATLRKWSERHAWVQRAADYDAFLVEQEREMQAIAVRSKAVKWAKRQEALKEAERQSGR